jgi:hypothetical protein
MPLFRRSPKQPEPSLPLARPALDGGGWPDAPGLGRAGFEVQTWSEIGERRAHDPDAIGLAERLLDALLPLLDVGAPPEDAPYVENTFTVAARRGAGLGLLEVTLPEAQPDAVDRRIAGALWQARRDLPRMREDWQRVASYLLLAAYWAARSDSAPHGRALAALVADLRAGPAGAGT